MHIINVLNVKKPYFGGLKSCENLLEEEKK